jgi:hypothetical protein
MRIKTIIIVICIFFNANIISVIANYNNPPNPPLIDGPITGKIGEKYVYYITLTDPDEDDHFWKLEVDFGNEVITEECSGGDCKPWDNGETIQIEYSWTKSGTYDIKARVMDVYGAWSNWSEPFRVIMPKIELNNLIFNRISNNKNINFFYFENIFLRYLINFVKL